MVDNEEPQMTKGWIQHGETMWVKETPTTTLYVTQLKMSGDWRAEHAEARRFGRLQIARVDSKEEAMKICERYAA